MTELEKNIYSVLETYSNVHRGSGHNSQVTSKLYDQARSIVLDYLGLPASDYIVIFSTPRRAALMVKGINPEKYVVVSSEDLGLSLGVRAVALKKGILPQNLHCFSGGGTARLVSPGWVIWSKGPERYEPGTPAIINIIAFTRALILSREHGKSEFINGNILNSDQILNEDNLSLFSGRMMLEELRKTIIGRDLEVTTVHGQAKYINLDNAASTRTFIPVWDAVRKTLSQGKEVKNQIIGAVRQLIMEFTGAPLSEYDVIFTSNTTEAISLAAESLSLEQEKGTFVVNTILEHNSNELPWRNFPGLSLLRIKADKNGFLDLAELEELLSGYNKKNVPGTNRIELVTITGASNVLGTFNDLEAISQIVHKYGARLLVDAAQMIAHRSIDIKKCAIDYLAFSGHKVYAPFGAGVLVVRKGLLRFSTDEFSFINSSGDENAAGIAGLGKSIVLLQRVGMDVIHDEEKELTSYAVKSMSTVKGMTLYGINDPDSRLFISRGSVISFSLKEKLANKVAKTLADRGIGVRSGCHCAHILVKYLVNIPPYLEQFQGFLLKLFPKLSLPGIVRVSIGIENNKKEIDLLVRELQRIA